MQKVLIDVGEHASRGLKGVICGFEPCVFMPILMICVARKNSRYVEDYRSLFVGKGKLRGRFVSKCIEPARVLVLLSLQSINQPYQVKAIFM